MDFMSVLLYGNLRLPQVYPNVYSCRYGNDESGLSVSGHYMRTCVSNPVKTDADD